MSNEYKDWLRDENDIDCVKADRDIYQKRIAAGIERLRGAQKLHGDCCPTMEVVPLWEVEAAIKILDPSC